MTTNQPIDGVLVSRKWLENIYRNGLDGFNVTTRTTPREELRALLDAKACTLCGKPTACGKMICEDCCYEMPGAQPQGEPVAVFDIDHTGYRCKVVLDSSKPLPPNGTKLYAEQPAPVAVTLQQVLAAYEYAESHPHKYLRGTTNWCAAVAHNLNACLDELKRLNPSL